MIKKFRKSVCWNTIKQAEWKWLVNILFATAAIILLMCGVLAAKFVIEKSGITEILNQREELLSGIYGGAENITEEDMATFTSDFLRAANRILFILIVLTFYSLKIYSLAKYFIYRNTYKKKFKKATLWKFIAFNIIAIALALTITYYILVPLKALAAAFMIVIILFLALYFFTFFNIIFFREEKIFKTIKSVYFLTITKFHRLIPAFGWILLALLIMLIPAYFLVFIPKAGVWLSLLPLLIWCTFSRYYLINVLEGRDFRELFKTDKTK